MTSRLNPYLHFKDTARAALDFYQGVFGGELTISTFGDVAGENMLPGTDAALVMHGQLETTSGFTLMGSDTPEHVEFAPGSTVTVSLSGDAGDELRGYWDKLSDGGTVTFQLQKQMWGDEFGMCIDKFGIEWMVNISQPTS